MTVRISSAASSHPAHRVSQSDAIDYLARCGADPRRVAAIARGSHIAYRQTVLPAERIATLGAIEERNQVYREHIGPLAGAAARAVLHAHDLRHIGIVASASCTGYQLPGLSSSLVHDLCLPSDAARIPLTESGCAGGVVALTAVAAHLQSRPGAMGLAVAAELCSLAFHAGMDDSSLTSNMIFGDGAGAASLENGPGRGIEIVDTASTLIPETQHALGFDLTTAGFVPVVDRMLPEVVPPALETAVTALLRRNEIAVEDVGAWLIHPGGARILDRIEHRLCIDREKTVSSWSSLHEHGNTSSAAIFDVLARYLDRPAPRNEPVVIAAFGPGVSIDLILGQRRC